MKKLGFGVLVAVFFAAAAWGLQTKVTVETETSDFGPALVSIGEKLLVGWIGDDPMQMPNVLPSQDKGGLTFAGGNNGDKKTFFGQSSVGGVGLARLGSEFLLFWSGRDQTLRMIRSKDGISWGTAVAKIEKIKAPRFTVATRGDAELFVCWTDPTSHGIKVSQSKDGTKFSDPVSVGPTTRQRPAIGWLGKILFIAYVGQEGRLSVVRSDDGNAWQAPTVIPNEFSNLGPALASDDKRIYLVFAGTDQHINVLSSSDGINGAVK